MTMTMLDSVAQTVADRSLAGAAHRWTMDGTESAVCDAAGDRRLLLTRSGGWGAEWTFVDDDTGEIIAEVAADSVEDAIGQIVSRVLAAYPSRAESASRMLRDGLKPRRGGIGMVLEVPSETVEGHFYKVIPAAQICDCPDFRYRRKKCKHLLLAERAV